MKDKIIYFLLGALTMLVVYGFSQNTISPDKEKSNLAPVDLKTLKSDLDKINSKIDSLQSDMDDVKAALEDIKNDTTGIDTIGQGVDAIGNELISPTGSPFGFRQDVNDIKTSVYDTNSTVHHFDSGRGLIFKNNEYKPTE